MINKLPIPTLFSTLSARLRSIHRNSIVSVFVRTMAIALLLAAFPFGTFALAENTFEPAELTRQEVLESLEKGINFFHNQVAVNDGYVYFYSVDLETRWGEGLANKDQIWVQPPSTPTVGMAYLKAFKTTNNPVHLNTANKTASSLIRGRLPSGGWSNQIDFKLIGSKKRRNNSSLDDGQTQSVILFLMQADQANGFAHKAIHDAALSSLNSLLRAQFPNGAFPQVWSRPVAALNVPK